MKLEISAETDEFTAALKSFIAEQRAELKSGIRFQSRLLAQLLVKLTPPTEGKTQGRQAVARDYRRLFVPILTTVSKDDERWGTNFNSPTVRKAMRKAVQSRDTAAAYAILKAVGFDIRPDQVVEFKPEMHEKERNRRGVVPQKRRDKLFVINPGEMKKALARSQSHVGQAKGAWAASVLALGGSVAGWIKVHARSGMFRDQLENLISPSVTMENASEWASAGDDDRIVSTAMKSRATQIRTSLAKKQFDALKRAKLA